MLIAGMDLGSNSFHLVVAEVGSDGGRPIQVVRRERELVRLGDGTFITGKIPADVLTRARRALERLAGIAREVAPDVLAVVATSAVRDAANRDALLAAAGEHGLRVRVLSGEEEARLVMTGARSWLGPEPRRFALFDMGGGSLEVALADGGTCRLATSLPLGALRLAQLEPLPAPAGAADVERVAARVRATLAPVVPRLASLGFDSVVLTSGTALTAGAMLDPAGGRPRTLTCAGLGGLVDQLAAEPLDGRGRRHPALDQRRADMIVHGLVVLRTVLEECRVESAILCPSALREGLLLETVRAHFAEGLPLTGE